MFGPTRRYDAFKSERYRTCNQSLSIMTLIALQVRLLVESGTSNTPFSRVIEMIYTYSVGLQRQV